jgi:hypothetical protein
VQPKSKGIKNPFQVSPTPCKNKAQPTQKQWGTIRKWICALKYKKNGQTMGLGSFGCCGKNGKMGGEWWLAVGVGGAEGPAVVRWVVGM